MKVGKLENSDLLRAIDDNDTTKVITELKDYSCPNAFTNLERSPLIVAIRREGLDISIIRHLLEYGADPNKEGGTFGETPLKIAVRDNNRPVIKLLIEFNADPNYHSLSETSPFEDAIYKGDIDLIKLFIENGADIYKPDSDGMTPLELGIVLKNTSVIRVLKYYEEVLPAPQKEEEPPQEMISQSHPAFDKLIQEMEDLEQKLKDAEKKIEDLEWDNRKLKGDVEMYEAIQGAPTTKSSSPSPVPYSTPDYYDEEDEDSDEEDYSFGLEDEADDDDGDWDYQEEDKTCEMCAGTGFMGASEEEGDETGCDEVTCPFCMGSGIK